MKIIVIFLSLIVFSLSRSQHEDDEPYGHCTCKRGPSLCASDFRTFHGICSMKCYNYNHPEFPVHKLYDGPCDALCGCKPDAPFCASNKMTFQSECEMKCFNNKYPYNQVHKVYNGECVPIYNIRK